MSNERESQLKKAGVIHKLVQSHAKELLSSLSTQIAETDDSKSAKRVVLYDMAESIENKIRDLTKFDPKLPLLGGVAFPTGLSVNECAAHWTPIKRGSGETFSPQYDILKVDFGVHLNGHIIDGAFSYTENPELQPLIDCSIEATNKGISLAGPDAILGDIGAEIQQIIESYEIVINGKTYPVKSIGDLCGHQIQQYKIHAGKAVPNIALPYYKVRMQEGEQYAIETFPSTGSGSVREDSDFSQCSHFMKTSKNKLKGSLAKLAAPIDKNFGSLAFCQRYAQSQKVKLSLNDYKKLTESKVIEKYPPLYDKKGSYVAQTEKCIIITSKGRIVLN